MGDAPCKHTSCLVACPYVERETNSESFTSHWRGEFGFFDETTHASPLRRPSKEMHYPRNSHMEVDSETRRRVAGNELSAPNHPGRDPTLKRNRLMTRSQLMGAHSHRAENGTWVHVYQRDGKFLVRGRFENHQFGKELGHDPAAAAAGLRRLLAELENGTFIR